MRISDWSSDVCSSDLVWGKPWLLGRGEPPDPARLAAPVAGIRLEWWLYILSILSIGVVCWLVQNQAVVGTLLGISGAILVIYVLATAVTKLPPHDRERNFAAMFLILGSIHFWDWEGQTREPQALKHISYAPD